MGSRAWWMTGGCRRCSRRAPAQKVVGALISEANGRGGLDNITAIVVRVHGVDSDTVPTQETEAVEPPK